MAELLSEQIRKQLRDTPLISDELDRMYDELEGLSDEEAKKYLYVNKPTFDKNPAFMDYLPDAAKYVSKEPDWIAKDIDYKKVTGSDDPLSDEKFNSYTMKDIENFGKEVGMSGRDFLKKMTEDKIAYDRHKIAHGEDEGGWFESPKSFAKNLGGAFMNVMAPRTQEAIERGEEPSLKDYALDIGQDVAETLPMGKIAKGKKAANFLLNFAVPAASETADVIAYDEDNSRGNASLADVMIGGSINYATPRLFNKIGVNMDNVGKTAGIPIKWLKDKTPEGQITDFVTNKAGTQIYSDRRAPGIIGMFVKPVSDYEKEEDTKKRKKKAKESATRKYLLGNEE